MLLSNRRTPQPKANPTPEKKKDTWHLGPLFFPQQIIFRWLGLILRRKHNTKPSTQQILRGHPNETEHYEEQKRNIKRNGLLVQVDIDVVKGAVRWSLYTNQITLTDVFRYSNIYVQTTLTRGKLVVGSGVDVGVGVVVVVVVRLMLLLFCCFVIFVGVGFCVGVGGGGGVVVVLYC